MKPKIGITPQYDNSLGIIKISPFYAKAIEESGGIPFILPYSRNSGVIEEYADTLDGILFAGGANVDPRLYGEKAQSSCGHIEFERDLFELALCKKATEKDIPVLGICRGCQLLAVASEGTLYQHLDGHDQVSDKHTSSHTVSVLENTLLYDILNADTTEVNSFHRQAVKTTGALKVAALGENDLIEAVYMPGKKFHLGLQWHPERMYSFDIHAKLIFDKFISSCC